MVHRRLGSLARKPAPHLTLGPAPHLTRPPRPPPRPSSKGQTLPFGLEDLNQYGGFGGRGGGVGRGASHRAWSLSSSIAQSRVSRNALRAFILVFACAVMFSFFNWTAIARAAGISSSGATTASRNPACTAS